MKLRDIIKRLDLRKLIMLVCVVAALTSLAYLAVYYYDSWQQSKLDDMVSALYSKTPALPDDPPLSVETPSLNHTPLPDQKLPPTESERERLLRVEQQGYTRFADMLEINADFRGMIVIEGLNMERPYVQASNNTLYLNRSFDGRSSDHGCIYLASYNDRLLLDKNTVLFGHNMKDDTMFAPLLKYADIQTVTNAPVIVLDSLSGSTTWLVFAAYTCEPEYDYISPCASGDDFASLLDEIARRSLFSTNVDVSTSDRILTLSTCDYEFEDARFAVHARLLRDGEQIPDATVQINPNPTAN